ncbi:MAG: dGTP triphosphohydrolase [Calditrichia bacterium]
MSRKRSKNKFYSDFDTQLTGSRTGSDYRSTFQRDRDRIIYSSALRRLQAKTQVFLSGEYDFYRTRLTHSIEVVQIGRSICHYLHEESPLLAEDFFIDPSLVEAICLAHDLGHPPFGHSGESMLNEIMKDYGGFEGNAQTLRILTKIIYRQGPKRKGMTPSRALLDGVLKYKTLRKQLDNPPNHFLYDEQKRYLNFVFNKRTIPADYTPGDQLNSFRSIECQIMDWADDTAYSLNDMIDGARARFLTAQSLEDWGSHQSLTSAESKLLKRAITVIKDGDYERYFSRKIGDFIAACKLVERENFMSDLTNRYHYELAIQNEAAREAALYKRIASDIVFDSPQLQQLRYKWNMVLERLFTAFMETYVDGPDARGQLLPNVIHRRVISLPNKRKKMRAICDHISGMTDDFAIRTYKRLFDPDFGSLMDLV